MATYQGIVDHRGRPIEKKVLTQHLVGPTLSGVRSPLSGYPGDGLTPPSLTQILREADQGQPLRFYELAETIEERDLHYAAVLGVRKRSVAQLVITIEDGSDDAAHKAQAEMVRDWLKRDELSGELFDILDAIGKGESFTYIDWDTSEGEWAPRSLDRWDQRWFRPLREDLTTPMLIGDSGVDEPLPPGAFIHLVARGKSGLPARSGLARLACWFWMFKGMTIRDLMVHNATFGQPVRVGKYGPNATQDDKDTLFQAVANIAGDCAAIIPDSMVIEFIEAAAGTGTALYIDTADWLDQQMSKATLGQTTTTDAISGGHAVSQEHRQVQEDIERADAKVVAAALTRDLIIPWVQLQYGPQKAYPRVRIGRQEQKDVEQIVATVRGLRLPMKKSEAYELAGISPPEDGDEVISFADIFPTPSGQDGQPVGGPPAGMIPPGGKVDPKAKEVPPSLNAEQSASGAAEADAEQAAIDRLAAGAGEVAGTAMDAVLELIAGVVAQSSTLEEVRTRLLALAPTISTKSLALALRQAQVVARLSGRGSLTDG